MSSIPAVLLLIISITVFSSSFSLSPQICTTNSDCPSDSCCLLGPSRYAIPTCMSFQQKGEQCRVNADIITTNLSYPDNSQIELKSVHFILCSCADGLSCNPKRGICN